MTHKIFLLLLSFMLLGVALTAKELQATSPTASFESSIQIKLTLEEKAWLADHKSIRIGVDPSWPPFEFFDATKVYSGIASDYVRHLNKELNINMAPVRNLSWPEVMNKARAGEIDVLPCVAKTPERSKFLLFSEPYISFPTVILTREDAPFVSGVQDFENGKVAIVKGYVTQELLQRDYPDLEFYLAKDIDAALQAVSKRKVDAFVGNLASITYTTQKLGLTNLKVAMTTPYKYELAFAVRKDWPELVNILNKSIYSIPYLEKTTIHNRWINVRFERKTNWTLIFQIVGAIVLVGGAFFILMIRWNRALSREVTERRRMEEALRESRATARGLLDATQESLLLLDKEGTIIASNQAAAQRLNKSSAELSGINLFSLLPQNISEARKAHFDNVLQTGNPADFEDIRDGMVFHHIYYPVQGETGAVTGVAIFAQDITDRKTAEEAIRQSRAQLQTIIDNVQAVVFMKDLGCRHLLVNKYYEEATGVKKDDALGKTDFEIFPKEVANQIVSVDRKVMSSAKMRTFEEKVPHSDGTLRHYLTTKVPLFNTEGNVYGMCGLATDITERKHMEEDLKRNVEELEQFSKLAIGREIKMIQLKEEINELLSKQGLEGKYEIVE